MSFDRKGIYRYLAFASALSLAGSALAFDTFNIGYVFWDSNKHQQIVDNYWTNGPSQSASGSASFTGMDMAGNTQTMNLSGYVSSSAEYGRLHSYSSASVSNSYYNPANAPAFADDGTFNPNGSIDDFSALGFAGFDDTLQFGGDLQAGYKAKYIFHVEGTNSDSNGLADLAFQVDSNPTESFFAFDPVNNTIWATQEYAIDGVNPHNVHVQFSNQAVLNFNAIPDGSSFTSISDFSSTLVLSGIEILDSNDHPVSGVTVTSASGTNYAVLTPEPGSLAALGLGAAALLRRRKKSSGS